MIGRFTQKTFRESVADEINKLMIMYKLQEIKTEDRDASLFERFLRESHLLAKQCRSAGSEVYPKCQYKIESRKRSFEIMSNSGEDDSIRERDSRSRSNSLLSESSSSEDSDDSS